VKLKDFITSDWRGDTQQGTREEISISGRRLWLCVRPSVRQANPRELLWL